MTVEAQPQSVEQQPEQPQQQGERRQRHGHQHGPRCYWDLRVCRWVCRPDEPVSER